MTRIIKILLMFPGVKLFIKVARAILFMSCIAIGYAAYEFMHLWKSHKPIDKIVFSCVSAAILMTIYTVM